MTDLAGRLAGGAHISIHGPSGLGKSKLARDTLSLLNETSDYRTVRISCSSYKDGLSVFRAIAASLGPAVGEKSTLYSTLSDMENREDSKDVRYLLLIENFDSIVEYEDQVDFVRLFRELLESPGCDDITCLLISGMPLEILEKSVRGNSTLDGVFFSIACPRLSPDDLGAVFPDHVLDDDSARRVIAESAGVFVLAQHFVETGPMAPRLSAADIELRDRWIRNFLRFLDRCDLLEALAQYSLGPIVNPPVQSKALLRSLGVLSSGEAGGLGDDAPSLGEYGWFRSALKENCQSLAAWGKFGELELAAQHTICAVLSVTYCDIDDVMEDLSPVGDVCRSAAARSIESGRAFEKFEDIVPYMRQGEYVRIIEALWGRLLLLGESRSKEYWITRLSQLGGFGESRNRVIRLDPVVIDAYTADLRKGFNFMKRDKQIGKKKTTMSRSPIIKVTAGDGNTISVAGSDSKSDVRVRPHGSAIQEAPVKTERRSRFSLASIWFGIVGSSATILTFILRIF